MNSKRSSAAALASLYGSGSVYLRSRCDYYSVSLPQGVHRRDVISDLLHIALPAGLEFALVQLVNMFDQIQIGSVSEHAIAAVGLASQVVVLFITIFIAVNVGVTALTARAVGQRDDKEVPIILEHGLLLSVGLSVIMSILGYIFADDVLTLLNPPDQYTFSLGVDYLRINMFGFLPLAMTATFTAALRGAGNAKTPLTFNITSNVVNVTLNWLLINGNLGFPKLEIRGAAIATITSQYIAFLLAYVVCLKAKRGIPFSIRNIYRSFDKNRLFRIIKIGVPSAIEQIVVRIGLSLFTILVASLGTVLYATHTICAGIQALTYMFGMAFQTASTTLSGQSIGQKREDMAVIYCRYCAYLSLGVGVLLMLIYTAGGPFVISLYRNDPAIIAAGTIPLRLIAIIQPFAAFQYVYSGALRGSGDTMRVALITVFTTCLCRPMLAYIAIHVLHFGLVGAWCAMVIDQIICAVLIVRRFVSCKWLLRLNTMGIERAT